MKSIHVSIILGICALWLFACQTDKQGADEPQSNSDNDADTLTEEELQDLVPDDDDDGIPNAVDNCRWVPNKQQKDNDGDGLGNLCDICPDDEDPRQLDRDGDGTGDACDNDLDGDGLVNERDLCPTRDSTGEPDFDADGWTDLCDVCPVDYDPSQANEDLDGLGDACELEDPETLSGIGFLSIFGEGELSRFSTSGGNFAEDASGLSISDNAFAYIYREQSEDFPSDYVIDVRGTYKGEVGSIFPPGTFGIIARMTERDLSHTNWNGYTLNAHVPPYLIAASRDLQIMRFDKGEVASDKIILDSQDMDPLVQVDQEFRMRAYVFGSSISVSLDTYGMESNHYELTVDDPEGHAQGGYGFLVDGSYVELHSFVVYKP